ncbi:hypothetical protein MKEN_01314100 [Mycena kentingensis (nom. inval.)]|nr:hypothetical protein MKEN_01314100 [Mycena kentingensis (nom. inval.)]
MFGSGAGYACALLLLAGPSVGAVPQNRTIDDTDEGFFTFFANADAPGAWRAVNASVPCSACSAQPLKSPAANIHDDTWHDGTVGAIGALDFRGSAVYIYGIDLGRSANISFNLSTAPGAITGPRTHQSHLGSVGQLGFQVPFFWAENLDASVNHTVRWELFLASDNGASALFDYAVITVDDELSPSPSDSGVSAPTTSSTSTASSTPAGAGATSQNSHNHSRTLGAIIGGTLGGFVLVAALLVILIVFLRRRRKRNRIPPSQMAFAKAKITGAPIYIIPLEEIAPSQPQISMQEREQPGLSVLPVLTPNRVGSTRRKPPPPLDPGQALLSSSESAAIAASSGAGAIFAFPGDEESRTSSARSSDPNPRTSATSSTQVVNEMLERQALALQTLQASWSSSSSPRHGHRP